MILAFFPLWIADTHYIHKNKPMFNVGISSHRPNKSPEPTAVGRFSSAFAGSRHESAVAQLSTLGHMTRNFFVSSLFDL